MPRLVLCHSRVRWLDVFLQFLGAMPPAPGGKPFNTAYYAQLIGSARARYEEKVRMCDGVDPYTLRPGTDTTTDVNALPEVTHGDIVNYLVYSSSFVTLQEMKAFKSLEAHNYFTSGWVKSLSTKRLQQGKVLLLGEVSPTSTFTCNHTKMPSYKMLRCWPRLLDGCKMLCCRKHAHSDEPGFGDRI